MNETNIEIKYRLFDKGIPPKRIKLDINGWAGENTYKSPQPWHCKPFSDAATYGLELLYCWDTELRVTCDENGKCHFNGDFSKEIKKDKKDKEQWLPYAQFAPYHFGFVSMWDIKTPDGYGLMVNPHPACLNDRTGVKPIAVQGLLESDWWPEIFFIVFKAPMKGCEYVFKKNDPIAQFTVVPKYIKYNISPMSEEEEEKRSERQGILQENWDKMCTRIFYCEQRPNEEDEFFDNKYKVLSTIAKREGNEVVNSYIDDFTKLPNYGKEPEIKDYRKETSEETKEVAEEIKTKKVVAQKPTEIEDMEDKIVGFLRNNKGKKLTDEHINYLIAENKRMLRKERKNNSDKNRITANPELLKKCPMHNMGEVVLGHKIEKLL